jgi:hypothetical protein
MVIGAGRGEEGTVLLLTVGTGIAVGCRSVKRRSGRAVSASLKRYVSSSG